MSSSCTAEVKLICMEYTLRWCLVQELDFQQHYHVFFESPGSPNMQTSMPQMLQVPERQVVLKPFWSELSTKL